MHKGITHCQPTSYLQYEIEEYFFSSMKKITVNLDKVYSLSFKNKDKKDIFN